MAQLGGNSKQDDAQRAAARAAAARAAAEKATVVVPTVALSSRIGGKVRQFIDNYSGGGGGGGGGYDPYAAAAAAAAAAKREADRKEADAVAKTVAAIHSQLGALDKSKAQTLANIDLREKQGRKLIDEAFEKFSLTLQGTRADNEKAEHDATFANRANRGRERGDILLEAAAQGAGETDNLRAQLMAARNWSANQQEVNRAFHDTQRNVNTDTTTLNQNTKTNMTNLYAQANVDRAKAWDEYYKSTADVWTQIFNAENAMHSNDQYTVKYADAGAKATAAIGGKWKDPGVPQEVQDWQGLATEEKMLNSSDLMLQNYGPGQALKKPEGATLRKW